MDGRPAWFPNWNGQTAVLVGSGPTAKDIDLEKAKGAARFIVVNDSWKLAPWADVLYAVDWNWWKKYEGCPEFKGLKICIDDKARRDWPGLEFMFCPRVGNRFDLTKTHNVGWGGNSGFGALNLAVKFGAKKILLVGYDMRIDVGKHWHEDHPSWMHNPAENNVKIWKRAVDGVADIIKDFGVTVINCSEISALSRYPKMSFEKALEYVSD